MMLSSSSVDRVCEYGLETAAKLIAVGLLESGLPDAAQDLTTDQDGIYRFTEEVPEIKHETTRSLFADDVEWKAPRQSSTISTGIPLPLPWPALTRGEPGVYVNFLGHEDDRIRDAYPRATWNRLTAIKATYDPNNLFRLNQNVTPASR